MIEFVHDDDGEGTTKRVELVGYAFLTVLNEIDRRAELKPDSEFRDLTLVMAIFVDWAKCQNNVLEMEGDPGTAPFPGAAKLMEGLEDEDIGLLKGDAKVDRWEWKAKFKEFESHHGKCYGRGDKPKLGGTQHDIAKMSRSERASYAFDHKDPLAHLPMKDIEAGGPVLR
nr:hypothetical protein B0A51_05746 [Rachicladosporium sp. CCFEE 5018]